jgi:shikimate dehydrogenase
MALAGIDGSSSPIDMPLERAAEIRGLFPAQLRAASVTMPLKMAALDACDVVSDSARRIGAANSLLWRDGALHADNVDGEGLLWALRDQLGFEPDGSHVKVLGSGGAARGIVDALIQHNAASIVLHARNEAAVAEIQDAYRNVFDFAFVYRPVDLIINTTPSSSRVNEGSVLQGVNPDTIAVDITYSPAVSPWLALHRELGCATQNGLPMLAYQAALQMRWWWDADLNPRQLLEVIA